MKIYYVLVLVAAVLFMGCTANQAPSVAESPGDVLRQYVAASQKGDIQTMKRLLSKGSLELIEKSAKAQGRTGDDILRSEAAMRSENIEYKLEMRNEKIEGDTATVELRNEMTGEFDMKMPLVKENGAWKLARDRFIEEEMKKANDEINKKLANSALSNSNSAVNSAANK